MKTITVVSDDRVGLLADISYILGKTKVNIESISVDVVGQKCVITLTVKDPDKAKQILEMNNYRVEESNVIVIKLEDRPGVFNGVTSSLAKEGINILNVHMLSRDGKHTVLAILVDKPKKAAKILERYLISPDSIQS